MNKLIESGNLEKAYKVDKDCFVSPVEITV